MPIIHSLFKRVEIIIIHVRGLSLFITVWRSISSFYFYGFVNDKSTGWMFIIII